MKRIALIALLAASPFAFAQKADPAQAHTQRELVRQMAVAMAPFMGILPELQKLCGHTPAQQDRVKTALAAYEQGLSREFGESTVSAFRQGASRGLTMFRDSPEASRTEKAQQACDQLNNSFEGAIAQMESAFQVNGAKSVQVSAKPASGASTSGTRKSTPAPKAATVQPAASAPKKAG